MTDVISDLHPLFLERNARVINRVGNSALVHCPGNADVYLDCPIDPYATDDQVARGIDAVLARARWVPLRHDGEHWHPRPAAEPPCRYNRALVRSDDRRVRLGIGIRLDDPAAFVLVDELDPLMPGLPEDVPSTEAPRLWVPNPLNPLDPGHAAAFANWNHQPDRDALDPEALRYARWRAGMCDTWD